MRQRPAHLVPGRRHVDQLHLGGGQVVLQRSVLLLQQELLRAEQKNIVGLDSPAAAVVLVAIHLASRPPPTSIFLTSASVSYHIWMDPGLSFPHFLISSFIFALIV